MSSTTSESRSVTSNDSASNSNSTSPRSTNETLNSALFRRPNGVKIDERTAKGQLFNNEALQELTEEINRINVPTLRKKTNLIIDFIIHKLDSVMVTKKRKNSKSTNQDGELKGAEVKGYELHIGIFIGKLINIYQELDNQKGTGGEWIYEKLLNRKRYNQNSSQFQSRFFLIFN